VVDVAGIEDVVVDGGIVVVEVAADPVPLHADSNIARATNDHLVI
jgi:hypothetical protein